MNASNAKTHPGTQHLCRSECLSALARIDHAMEDALAHARLQSKDRILRELRELVAPFDLSRHDLRIASSAGEDTYLSLTARHGAGEERSLSSIRGDGLLLDVLQEIDYFLHSHQDWAGALDGATLNGDERAPSHFGELEPHSASRQLGLHASKLGQISRNFFQNGTATLSDPG